MKPTRSAGAIDFGGLDASLAAAPAELNQAAIGEAAPGDAARGAGMDDRAGAGAEAHVLVEFAQFRERGGEVEWCVIDGGVAELLGQLDGETADRFLGIFDDDLEDTAIDGLRYPGEGDRAAGLRLQP